MAKSYLLHAATPELRNSSGLNACLVSNVADPAAAKAAAIAAKPSGGVDDANVTAWTAIEISASALTNLPAGVVWLDGIHNLGASGRTF
jgi:Asp/Glu/hydantoin racemase